MKTIKKTIVGMMNQLRIARSDIPCRANDELLDLSHVYELNGSSRASALKRMRHAYIVRQRPASAEVARERNAPAPKTALLQKTRFCENTFPVLGQRILYIFGRSTFVGDDVTDASAFAPPINISAYSGMVQKSFTICID